MIKTAVLALILAVLSTAPVAEDAPRFPDLTGRVVDEAGLLDPGVEAELARRAAAHEASTSNQVVIVTLDGLQGRTIEEYGYQLGRHWGIGQAEHDNGVLLIVAPNERKVRIEVGYGLEGTLTDALSHRIIQERILPAFRQGDFVRGIQQGFAAILAVLEHDPATVEALSAPAAAPVGLDLAAPMLILLAVIGNVVRTVTGRRGLGLGVGLAGLPLFWWITGSILAALVLGGMLLALVGLMGLGGSGRGPRPPYRGHWGAGSAGGAWGGGGFSGGGGSFGGGGASGSW